MNRASDPSQNLDNLCIKYMLLQYNAPIINLYTWNYAIISDHLYIITKKNFFFFQPVHDYFVIFMRKKKFVLIFISI